MMIFGDEEFAGEERDDKWKKIMEQCVGLVS